MIKISIQYDKEAHLIKEAYCLHLEVSAYQTGASLVAQKVKNLPKVQETQV